jgi:ligand-binding sensor domain-containing protein
LWFGTQAGVSRFDGQTWTTYDKDSGLNSNNIQYIAAVHDGTLWFASGGDIARFDGESWTAYAIRRNLADSWVSSIAIAPDGTLWLGARGGGGVVHFMPPD